MAHKHGPKQGVAERAAPDRANETYHGPLRKGAHLPSTASLRFQRRATSRPMGASPRRRPQIRGEMASTRLGEAEPPRRRPIRTPS